MMPLFKTRGFYLHACWTYRYPFAVRTWQPGDYEGMFHVLRQLGLNQVMVWPMAQIVPPPLSQTDAAHLTALREVGRKAHEAGLQCWLTFCPNLSSTEGIRGFPMPERPFYPFLRRFLLDDAAQFESYIAHLGDLLGCLNNADGYVFIDGDPGGYPGAQPPEFLAMLRGVRSILDRVATEGRPKIIPWIWCGWGADWEKEGAWKPDLRKLVRPFLRALVAEPPDEPWELLPGRSAWEDHANGRVNFELAEEAGLISRSTLMTYEIIEFEPSAPAFVLQFDHIRRVIRQEMGYGGQARGIMGNAQQPVTALHNVFYFAQCARDPGWLERTDREVLGAFAEFLGGDPAALVPAWTCAYAGLDPLPPDTSARLRVGRLTSDAAQHIPGGPQEYLDILADFVDARLGVVRNIAESPRSAVDAGRRLSGAVHALVRWWSRHRYVFSAGGNGPFEWKYTHPLLLRPLLEWIQAAKSLFDESLQNELASEMAESGAMTRETAEKAVSALIRG